MRKRIGEFDPVERLSDRISPIVSEILFGALCFAVAVLTRAVVDLFSPGAGPFSLIYPAIMISTLYGRWQAGMVTFFLAFFHAWYFVLPEPASFVFANPADASRTMVNGAAALVILFFAEAFRNTVSRAKADRERELATQVDLMRELEHRTKNNFAMVASLLTLQQRTTGSAEAQEALRSAATRVRSFAAIHEAIYASETYTNEIPLHPYLAPLVRQLAEGLFQDRAVTIELHCDPVSVPRDRAVALGLIVNELVTNAAKHAFPDQQTGRILVEYRAPEDGPWRLVVSDDGIGSFQTATTEANTPSGLGSQLLQAFATTAGGSVTVEHTPTGTIAQLVEEPGQNGT